MTAKLKDRFCPEAIIEYHAWRECSGKSEKTACLYLCVTCYGVRTVAAFVVKYFDKRLQKSKADKAGSTLILKLVIETDLSVAEVQARIGFHINPNHKAYRESNGRIHDEQPARQPTKKRSRRTV